MCQFGVSKSVDDEPFGQHPLVCSVISGLFNLPNRPQHPKYAFVMFNLINFQWVYTETLPEWEISFKLCILLALIRHQEPTVCIT